MIFCIDMKSFFASVECSLRNLNPLTTPLVVCDESRGKGALILAASPYLKKYGIPSRCRLFEIPKELNYIKARPRMQKYMEYTASIHEIFLNYVDQSDIHTYSVDESFLDVTKYLKFHCMSVKELALSILQDIKEKLGIVAVCGAGDNLFLAKLSLDLYAKHKSDYFFYLSADYFFENTWYHSKLTDIWQIGKGISKRLGKLGLTSLADIAKSNVEILKKEFGVIGEDIYEHAWGRDDVSIADIKAYKPLSKSMSRNQVLFRDYTKEEAWIPICEMLYLLCIDLVKENLICSSVHFGVVYSDDGYSHKSFSLDNSCNDYFFIKKELKKIYQLVVLEKNIRVIYLSFSGFSKTSEKIKNLFNFEDDRYEKISNEILNIWKKYGKNKLVIGTAITNESTLYKRNLCIGGHNSD